MRCRSKTVPHAQDLFAYQTIKARERTHSVRPARPLACL